MFSSYVKIFAALSGRDYYSFLAEIPAPFLAKCKYHPLVAGEPQRFWPTAALVSLCLPRPKRLLENYFLRVVSLSRRKKRDLISFIWAKWDIYFSSDCTLVFAQSCFLTEWQKICIWSGVKNSWNSCILFRENCPGFSHQLGKFEMITSLEIEQVIVCL